MLNAAEELSKSENFELRKTVMDFALSHGMTEINDTSGTNISVQIIDCSKLSEDFIPSYLNYNSENAPILLVMDYAFGEQAYELMDELL